MAEERGEHHVEAELAQEEPLEGEGRASVDPQAISPSMTQNDAEKSQGSVPKDLEGKFKLEPKDRFVSDFSCAIKPNILQQGRLYLLTTKFCYSSPLSSEILVIPVSDIKGVEKRSHALVFDNCIAVKTVKGEIVFVSFFARDKALQTMKQLLKDPSVFENGQPVIEPERGNVHMSPAQGNTPENGSRKKNFRSQEVSPVRVSSPLDSTVSKNTDSASKLEIRKSGSEENIRDSTDRIGLSPGTVKSKYSQNPANEVVEEEKSPGRSRHKRSRSSVQTHESEGSASFQGAVDSAVAQTQDAAPSACR